MSLQLCSESHTGTSISVLKMQKCRNLKKKKKQCGPKLHTAVLHLAFFFLIPFVNSVLYDDCMKDFRLHIKQTHTTLTYDLNVLP